jgi:mannose-1-phosphate guanylyltransferase
MLRNFLKRGLRNRLRSSSAESIDAYKEHLYALIVVGGGGTRLWPRSRNKTPKQFLKLFGKKTLTQLTLERFEKVIPWEKIFVITTSDDYKKEILNEVPQIKAGNIIVEPARKNTAPAHALGALYIYRRDKDAVIVNVYVDQLINPLHSYLRVSKAAAATAYSGDWLVAIGVKPTYPNVGYGYIKRGSKWKMVNGKMVYKLDKFTEKPKLELAKKYLASGDYYWNAGQYIWRADSFLKAINKYSKEVALPLEEISRSLGTRRENQVIVREYAKMPEISVDFAVSEKADNFLLITADYNWIDIGDWKEVWENLPKDDLGNVLIDGDEEGGRVINLDTSDALIHTDGRLIAVIDVDNIVVVDTKDALLVCSKSKAQNVKKIVEQLKEEKNKELL